MNGRLAGIRTPICTVWTCRVCRLRHEPTLVAMGGLEPPLDRLSTCCLCQIGLHGHGPSGWTRTTTSRVKSPACCIDTTEGERMTGLEPVPQGLEGLQAAVTPHSHWIGLRVSNPSLHDGTVGCCLHTQAEHGPVLFTGPPTSFSCQRHAHVEHTQSPALPVLYDGTVNLTT
jgi:hypothetical protein